MKLSFTAVTEIEKSLPNVLRKIIQKGTKDKNVIDGLVNVRNSMIWTSKNLSRHIINFRIIIMNL